MTRLAIGRFSVVQLFVLLLSTRTGAQQIVVQRLPAPPEAKEALYGSISPDGRSFAYEVVEGNERLLWKLDLGTLQAERLTAAPGVRNDPAWAPDSKHLTYWRHRPVEQGADSSDGLYVLDVDSRSEWRVVKSVEYEALLAGKVAWIGDGRIIYWHMLEPPGFGGNRGRFELSALREDAGPASSPARWMQRWDIDEISPSGTRLASEDSCCGGARQAIAMRNSNGARCVAGPIELSAISGRPMVWARDEKRLYVLARAVGGTDTLEHAFAIDLERHWAWRIGPIDRPVASVSVTDGGDVALTVMPVSGRVGALWTIAASRVRDPEPGATRLQHCPSVSKSLENFVRSAKLPKVHSIDPRYEDSANGLTVFAVTYGDANEIYPMRMGLQYGSRIGWIAGASAFRPSATSDSKARIPVVFPLRSSDAYLFSDSLAERFKRLSDVDEFWRNFLLGNPATPFDVIIREVRRDPHRFALVALENPTVLADTISFDARLKLAALEDTLAMSTVWLASVHTDPERLARVADVPMYRSPGRGVELVHEEMQREMPTLVKNAHALSERAALHVYMAEALAVTMHSDSLRIAFLRNLAPHQHRVIFALEALRNIKVNFGREALGQLGSTPERELLEAVRRIRANELPPSLPDFMLLDARQLPWSVLEALSRLDERFRYVRAKAALALAAQQATPDSVLRVLALGLQGHRDLALAEQLLERAITDTSRALLEVIADLDSVRYATTPGRAREKLAKLDPRASLSVGVVASSRRDPPSPAVSDSNPYDSWMASDQCLPADDWSEQLRLLIGDGVKLIVGHSLCFRAAAALDSVLETGAYDSVYVFRVPGGWALAMPPKRADADVTLVDFDNAFIERARRVVRIH